MVINRTRSRMCVFHLNMQLNASIEFYNFCSNSYNPNRITNDVTHTQKQTLNFVCVSLFFLLFVVRFYLKYSWIWIFISKIDIFIINSNGERNGFEIAYTSCRSRHLYWILAKWKMHALRFVYFLCVLNSEWHLNIWHSSLGLAPMVYIFLDRLSIRRTLLTWNIHFFFILRTIENCN